MKIEIQEKSGHGDCETCGYYEWANVVVLIDGKPACEFYYDGHLGGGDPERSFDPSNCYDLLTKVLKVAIPGSEISVTNARDD